MALCHRVFDRRRSGAKGQDVLNLALVSRLAGARRWTLLCGQQIICQMSGTRRKVFSNGYQTA
jgi:hypothetical protein